MKTIKFIFIFTILFNAHTRSQVISGKINMTGNSSQAVEFVNVGIKGKNFGTVSDNKGNYNIDLTGKPDNDTIVFSHINCYPFICTINDLKRKSVNNEFNLELKERMVNLNTIVVQKRKTVIKWLGDEPSNAFQGRFHEDKLGCEVGTVFRFEKKKGKLKKISLKIANSNYDSLFFRINVYNLKDGIPDFNILKQPIYYKCKGKYPKGSVLIVDLDEQDIYLEQNFAVTFEMVKDLGKGGLNFPFTLLRKNTVSRSTSQAMWNTKIYGIGMKTEIEIEK